MIPLRDDVPASRTPVVTRAIVVACAVVFLAQLATGNDGLVERFGMVPARVLDPDTSHVLRDRLNRPVERIDAAAVPDWLTLVTCTFLHGGWLHFLGNMLFLWIFGDNVEDRFGRGKFVLFYLGCGAAASAAHLLASPESKVPTIGASGAIAGVMGALYLMLYPRARVQMLLVLGFLIDVVVLPASFFLVYWFVLQLVQSRLDPGLGGGVAWWAHIGGFVVGAVVAGLLRLASALRPAPPNIVLSRRRYVRTPWL